MSESKKSNKYADVHLYAVGNPECSAEVLDLIAEKADNELLLQIVSHKNVSKKTIVEMTRSKDAKIAEAAYSRLTLA